MSDEDNKEIIAQYENDAVNNAEEDEFSAWKPEYSPEEQKLIAALRHNIVELLQDERMCVRVNVYICVCSSVVCSSVVCRLSSVVCALWSVVCGLWSVVCGLLVCGLWSVVCLSVFCVCGLCLWSMPLSAVCIV
jgi:hypothetical protein